MAYFEDILNGLTQPAPMRPTFGSMAVKPQAPTATTGVAPSMAQPKMAQDTSGWDDMATFFAGMGEGGGALLPALGAGARAVSQEGKRRQAVNQTKDFLLRNGVSAEDADATLANPDLLKLKLGQIFKPAPSAPAGFAMRPDGTMAYVPGGPEDPATIEAQTKARAMAQGANGVQYGSTLYWTQDGRPYVMGSDGSSKFVDLGDAKPLAPGELASEKARGAATGKAVGEAKAALPGVLQSASETVKLIDTLMESKGLDRIVGTIDSRTPNLFPEATAAQARFDQMKGRAFLEGFKSLRGGGQITEKEGTAAQQAIARLDQAQDEKAVRAALQDLRDITRNAVIRAQVDAGALPPSSMAQLRDFENISDIVAPPPGPAAQPAQQYREQPQVQGQNPRVPGYVRGAPPAPTPNTTNPRAPGYQAPTRTLDAGDGFTVKVK